LLSPEEKAREKESTQLIIQRHKVFDLFALANQLILGNYLSITFISLSPCGLEMRESWEMLK